MWSTVAGSTVEGEATEDSLLQKLGEIGWLDLEERMERWRSAIRLLSSLAWVEKFLKWIYNWIKTIFPMKEDSRNEHWKILNVNNYSFKCNWLSESNVCEHKENIGVHKWIKFNLKSEILIELIARYIWVK